MNAEEKAKVSSTSSGPAKTISSSGMIASVARGGNHSLVLLSPLYLESK